MNTIQMNTIQMNVRVYLNIPFWDKEDAKLLGCKWDPEIKKWFCIDSDRGRSHVTKCLELWGKNAYKIIDDEKILIENIPTSNRGFTK